VGLIDDVSENELLSQISDLGGDGSVNWFLHLYWARPRNPPASVGDDAVDEDTGAGQWARDPSTAAPANDGNTLPPGNDAPSPPSAFVLSRRGLTLMWGGGSASKWCNQQFDDLINKAATITDQAERKKLYLQAQVIMHEEAPFFLIAHSVVFMPMRSNVTGYVMSPLGAHQFDQVDLK